MNLVFFDSERELELAKAFFPRDNFVLTRIVRSEKEFLAFKQFASKKSSQKFCVVLPKPDAKLVQKAKQTGFFVGVWAASPNACLFGVQQKTNFLLQPAGFEKPVLDLSVLRVAAQNNVALGLFFSSVLNANALECEKWFWHAFFLARLCKKARVSFQVFSGASTFEECRSKKDLDCLKAFLGAQ